MSGLGRPISVLHLITTLDTGGAQTMLRNLVTGMDRSGFSNQVVSMTAGGTIGEEIRRAGVPVVDLKMRRGWPGLRALARLRKVIHDGKPDIVQTWLYHADLLGTVATGFNGKATLLWNVRCTGMDMSSYRVLSAVVRRTLVSLSRIPIAVIANSNAGITSHEEIGYRPRRWVMIDNGFDTVRFQPDPAARLRIRAELGLPPESVLVGLIARFDPMKGHQTFLEAAAIVKAGHPEVHFVMAGMGVDVENAALRQSITRLGLDGRVHLLSLRTDVPVVTASLDVACSTSWFGEGFPNAVGEAMACGVVTVVTDVGDAGRVVGQAGLVVQPRDARETAAAILRWIESPSMRAQAGVRARQRIIDEFSIETVTRRYEDFYRAITNG